MEKCEITVGALVKVKSLFGLNTIYDLNKLRQPPHIFRVIFWLSSCIVNYTNSDLEAVVSKVEDMILRVE